MLNLPAGASLELDPSTGLPISVVLPWASFVALSAGVSHSPAPVQIASVAAPPAPKPKPATPKPKPKPGPKTSPKGKGRRGGAWSKADMATLKMLIADEPAATDEQIAAAVILKTGRSCSAETIRKYRALARSSGGTNRVSAYLNGAGTHPK